LLIKFERRTHSLSFSSFTVLLYSFISSKRWLATHKVGAEAVEDRINRGAGYGLEIPCIYCLCGPRTKVKKKEEFVGSLIVNIWTMVGT